MGHNIGSSGDTLLQHGQIRSFKPDEETIESWLEKFEIRLLCHNIQVCIKKRHWCQALVGEAGRKVISKLSPTATWEEIKQELCDVLGEANPKDRAFDILLNYRPGDKGLGEIATDIMTRAIEATDDEDAQNRLGLRAFLSAVPSRIGKELRKRHLYTVKEALDEARFLQRAEFEDSSVKEQVLAVDKTPSSQELVEECLKKTTVERANRGAEDTSGKGEA